MENTYPRKSICFIVQCKQHYSKLLRIAKLLDDEFDITFLIDDYQFRLGKDRHDSFYRQVTLSDNSQYFEKEQTAPSQKERKKRFLNIDKSGSPIIGKIKKTMKPYFILVVKLVFLWPSIYKLRILYRSKIYKKIINAIENHLLLNNYSIVILAEANVEYLSEAYIKIFKKFNIPSLIIPYTFCSPTEPAQAYYNDRNRRYRWYHKFFVSENWVYVFNNRKLLRMPLANILSINKLGVAPPQPWIQESSTANTLVVESNVMKEHYLKCRLNPEGITRIGDVSHDDLFNYYKDRSLIKSSLCQELDLDENKQVMVFSVFPDFMDKFADRTGFKNYNDMISFICTELKKINHFELVLCLHPALKREDFRFIEELGVKISSRLTPELIAVSDLYIASISATIRWALALGVPVINYDCYQFKYGDYNNVPGVINAETQQEFSKAVDQFKANPTYLQDLSLQLESVKQDWGVIDGQFHLRLKNLINQLIERDNYENSSHRMWQNGVEAYTSLDRTGT